MGIAIGGGEVRWIRCQRSKCLPWQQASRVGHVENTGALLKRSGKGRAGMEGELHFSGWGGISPEVVVPAESKEGSGVSLSVLLGSSRSPALTAR